MDEYNITVIRRETITFVWTNKSIIASVISRPHGRSFRILAPSTGLRSLELIESAIPTIKKLMVDGWDETKTDVVEFEDMLNKQ